MESKALPQLLVSRKSSSEYVLLKQEFGILPAVHVEKLGIMHALAGVLTIRFFYCFVTIDVSLAVITIVILRCT